MESPFQYKQFPFLDNLECFSSDNENQYFPFHLHEYHCITFVRNGTEQIQTREGSYLATAGSISITFANEAHQNSSVDDAGYSYDTLYINPELLAFFNEGKPVEQLQKVIEDESLAQILKKLSSPGELSLKNAEFALRRLVSYNEPKTRSKEVSFDLLDELIASTDYSKISLDWLAKQFCMSKYNFIRRFKSAKGITPQAYVLIKRLQIAKRMLLQGSDIKTAAYSNGFYDATHLNTALKRFFGVNALTLKNSNIIHRDGLSQA